MGLHPSLRLCSATEVFVADDLLIWRLTFDHLAQLQMTNRFARRLWQAVLDGLDVVRVVEHGFFAACFFGFVPTVKGFERALLAVLFFEVNAIQPFARKQFFVRDFVRGIHSRYCRHALLPSACALRCSKGRFALTI